MPKLFSNLGRLFGLKSSEKPSSKASHQMPIGSLAEIPGYEDLFQRVGARSRGEGLGIDPSLLQRDTSALAAQRRAGLTEQTLPTISAQASARGVGRSTIPVGQAGLASQATERDIESRLAQTILQNEQLKAQQQQQALGQSQSLIGQEAAIQNARRLAESGEFERIAGLRRERDTAQQAGLGSLLSTGLGALSGGVSALGPGTTGLDFFKGAFSGGLGGFNPQQLAGTESSLIDLILSNRGAAAVPTASATDFSILNRKPFQNITVRGQGSQFGSSGAGQKRI